MIEFIGNIWDFHHLNNYVVIPTNLGWNKQKENIMGAGLALQAREIFPELPVKYGKFLMENPVHHGVVLYKDYNIICFPTKKRNTEQPWLSWQQKSDLELIEKGCVNLAEITKNINKTIAIPMVGCGCGELHPNDVRKILDKYLDDKKFILVRRTK